MCSSLYCFKNEAGSFCKLGALVRIYHDQLATGQKLRILTTVDTHSRYSPATDLLFSYRGEDVVQTLERVCRQIGCPKTIRVDNGVNLSLKTLIYGLV